MAVLDDELLCDAEDDAREAQFIAQSLPSELKDRFTQDDILYLMDLIVEYYFESGILESDEDYVDIDLQAVADAVCEKAAKEGHESYSPDDVFFIVQADMDYQEQNI